MWPCPAVGPYGRDASDHAWSLWRIGKSLNLALVIRCIAGV
jgi:hypothetical protein